MTPEELDRLDALLSGAREVDGCSDHGCVLRIFPRGGMGTNGGCHCVSRDDADGMVAVRASRLDLTRLLALARQTPTLVAEVRRLRAEVEGLRGALKGVHDVAEALAHGARHADGCPALRASECTCGLEETEAKLYAEPLLALLGISPQQSDPPPGVRPPTAPNRTQTNRQKT